MRRFDPFRELERLFDEDWVPMFPAMRFRGAGPAANVSDTEREVVVEFDLPGIDPKRVDITIEDQTLTVSGGEEKEEKEERRNYLRREFQSSRFSRSITLPVAVKEEQARAEYKDGILKLILPKLELTPKKKVTVEVK